MNEREKRNLKRQLQMQADALAAETNTGKLAMSMVATCNSLLKTVASENINGLSKNEFENLYAGYLSVAAQIMKFYGSSENTYNSGNEQGDLLKMLKDETEKIVSSQNMLESSQERLTEQRRKNAELNAKVEKQKAELAQANQIYESLQAMERECSLEIINKQKEKNTVLFTNITEKKKKLSDLEKEEEKLEKENNELTGNISAVHQKIESVPEENAELLKQYNEKKELLDKLLVAKSEYNQEKQQELQVQIDEMAPVIEELQSNYDILKNRMETLNQQKLHYDQEKQELSTNVLEIINGSLAELGQVMKERESALKEVKKKADSLAENVKACDTMRKEYADWFESVQTPLESMITSINRPEFAELRKTLNVGEIDVVKKIFEDVRHNLNELDGILEKCVAATRKDQKNLERRIRP